MSYHNVEHDSAGPGHHTRLTCRTCADATLVRQPWMTQSRWDREIAEFYILHPVPVMSVDDVLVQMHLIVKAYEADGKSTRMLRQWIAALEAVRPIPTAEQMPNIDAAVINADTKYVVMTVARFNAWAHRIGYAPTHESVEFVCAGGEVTGIDSLHYIAFETDHIVIKGWKDGLNQVEDELPLTGPKRITQIILHEPEY